MDKNKQEAKLKFTNDNFTWTNLNEGRKPTANSTYPKVAVLWLNQALCFYQSLCLVESEVLRNRHLRQAQKRV